MSNSPTPPDVDVTFYDNFVPSLPDGEYKITVSQALTVNAEQTEADGGTPGNVPNAPQSPLSQKFIVRGPRFALDPADVHRVFPPANGGGVYHEYLPMIVFNKRALPWERALKLSALNPTLYPWLALLVFSEDDLPSPQPPGSQKNPTRTISVPLTEVNAGLSPGPPSGTLGPALTLEDDEDPTQIFCNVVDVPVNTFAELLPSLDDLLFLAHVRQVSTENKVPLNTKHDGWFSSVIGNRFAIPPPEGAAPPQQRNIVHLVSLEGFEHYLGTDTPVTPAGYQTVRLISLYSWAYTCLPDPQENFHQLMLNLISAQSEQGTDLLLRLPLPDWAQPPAPGAQTTAFTRLQSGYVPLSYATQTGEQTFAWYRGPLSPVVTESFLETTDPSQPENMAAPLNSSAAMIFDPTTGLFDQSYAVAFQTGRSLALSSLPFATNLLQWRRDAHGLIDRLLEYMRSNLASVLQADQILDANGNLTDVGITDLAELLDAKLISNAFKDYLATDFYDDVAKHIGKTGGFTPPDESLRLTGATQQQPVVPSDLSQLMQDPTVVSLLQHLSGLATIGTTSGALSASVTSIPLQTPPGASEAIDAGATLTVVSPDGKSVAIAKTSGAVAPGDTQMPIETYDFQTELAAGSTVRLRESNIMPEQVVEWLAQTALLYNVPFNNLVPDERMLPQESIRFFYIDPNWTNSLLDGALSVGIQSSRDSLFHQLMRDALHRSVDAVLSEVRDSLRNVSGAAAVTPGMMAGFILRSAVVSGWPGLEVRAYTSTDQTNPMKPLRLDRLGPNVMIGIYPDVPQRIEINEPSEGLVFGMEEEGIDLRFLPDTRGETGANIGQYIEPKITLPPADIPKRAQPPANAALKIGGVGGLVEALQNLFPGQKPTMKSAAFAVEMVRVPEQMLFLPENGAKK